MARRGFVKLSTLRVALTRLARVVEDHDGYEGELDARELRGAAVVVGRLEANAVVRDAWEGNGR